MAVHPQKFTPRQQMIHSAYELQYKRDKYLKDVELHHHDFFEIYFLVSGDVTYTIENKVYRVLPGDLLLISPMELHQVNIRPEHEAYERYVLWVDPKTLRQLSSSCTDLGISFDPSSPDYRNCFHMDGENQRCIGELMQRLYQESQTDGYGSDLLRNSLLVQILVSINRIASSGGGDTEEAVSTSKPVSEAIAYIAEHYSEPLSLDLLADKLYVSKYHLSHEFQRLAGTSVCRYIQKKRLMIARQLLSSGEKPGTVFSACGFGDYAAFYRAFRKEYHTSPREYIQSLTDDGGEEE